MPAIANNDRTLDPNISLLFQSGLFRPQKLKVATPFKPPF